MCYVELWIGLCWDRVMQGDGNSPNDDSYG